MLEKLFKKSLEDEALRTLQMLGKKFINGTSEPNDIADWEINLKAVIYGKKNLNYMPIEAFISGMEDLFIMYKLKHYPNKAMLAIKDIEIYRSMRNNMYRKMIIITLGEVLYITHKWEYKDKKEYDYLKGLINDYVNSHVREIVTTTNRCDHCSDNDLWLLLNTIKASVFYNTKQQKEWHEKVEKLDTFKVKNMPKLIKRYKGKFQKRCNLNIRK